MYELRLHERIAQIPREKWDALAGADASPFVEWTWLDCLEQSECVGPESGWHPCHLALYQTGGTSDAAPSGTHGQLVAAIPAYIKTNSEGEFVFDWSWADLAARLGSEYYPKLVCAVPFTPATGARVLISPDVTGPERTDLVRTFAAEVRKLAPQLGVHGVHVLFPPESELGAWVDVGYLPRYGLQYHWHNRGFATFEDFLRELPSKRRTQIRREMRQPQLDGVTIETLGPDDLTPQLVATMYELYLTTVDKFTWGRRYLNPRFFELVAERFRDRLAWVVARQGSRVLASAFNVRKGPRLYGRYWGTFVEMPFLHFNVCYYHGIRQSIEQGIQVFEPGAGGEHKRPRGFDPTITYSAHHLEHPRLRLVLRDYLARERDAIQAHIASGGEEEP